MSQDGELSGREHFDAIVRRYQAPLLRYACTSLPEADAQDVVQEVFVKLHRTMVDGGLREIASVGPWLFRVAHTCTADVFRSKKADQKLVAGAASDCPGGGCGEPGSLETLVHKEDCTLTLRLLDTLPLDEKRVVLLKVEQGMTYRQIGETMQLPHSTVAYLMSHGLDRLSKAMKAAGII